MLFLRRPSAAAIRLFLEAQAGQAFTYAATGAAPPAGYVVDHTRVRLGTGEPAFAAARAALAGWRQFRLGWVEALPADTPIEPDRLVAVLGWSLGLWWLNACRIVSVVDEAGPVSRFGFTYATLPGHIATGEERFLIEWDRQEDGVWYDLRAYSRPRHFLARLGYPWMRRVQKRFGRESAAAMRRAVEETLAARAPTEGGG